VEDWFLIRKNAFWKLGLKAMPDCNTPRSTRQDEAQAGGSGAGVSPASSSVSPAAMFLGNMPPLKAATAAGLSWHCASFNIGTFRVAVLFTCARFLWKRPTGEARAA